jgi:hypothetical protein
VGIEIRDGFGHDQVLLEVREALRAHLWPLAPGGAGGTGWPLARSVEERELEVVVARVPGIQEVLGVRLFARGTVGGELRWRRLQGLRESDQAALRLEMWQLPELLGVVVAAGAVPETPGGLGLDDGTGGDGTGGGDAIPIPVVPEVC